MNDALLISGAKIAGSVVLLALVLRGVSRLAKLAKAGDRISFFGPGGAWAPTADYDHFVLVGDEAAAPAICAALEELPDDATAVAFLEVADHSSVFDVPPSVPGVEIVWVFREGAPYGLKLAQAVREAESPRAGPAGSSTASPKWSRTCGGICSSSGGQAGCVDLGLLAHRDDRGRLAVVQTRVCGRHGGRGGGPRLVSSRLD